MNKKTIITGLSIIGIILIGIFIFNMVNKSNNDEKENEKVNEITAFALKNADGKYEIFNVEGKKIGDSYKSVSNFVNGAAIVQNNDGEYALIKDNGQYIIKFGEYKELKLETYLFRATTKENKKVLINSAGKVIVDVTDASIMGYSIVIVKNDKNYTIYSSEGKIITSFEINKESKINYNYSGNYHNVFHNGTNYLINIIDGKLIAKYNSDNPYYISSVNGEMIIVSDKSTTNNTNYNYKVFKKDKIVYESNNDLKQLGFEEFNLVGETKEGKKYVFDQDFKKDLLLNNNISYFNSKTYIEEKDKKTTFYKDGNKEKEIDNLEISEAGNVNTDIFLLTEAVGVKNTNSVTGIEYRFYNSKGERINNEYYSYAKNFDTNELAFVRYTNRKHALINKKGEKITPELDEISSRTLNDKSIIYLTETETEKAVLNNKGEKIYAGDFSSLYVEKYQDKLIAKATDKEKNNILTDITTNKELIKTKGNVTLEKFYFTVKENDKTTYYTYNGNKILEI